MITLVLALTLSALLEQLHDSCNTGTRYLSDMYTLSPPALGIHIGQITLAHVTTLKYERQPNPNYSLLSENIHTDYFCDHEDLRKPHIIA